ncbi:MAG: hypothetical protein AB3N19_02300 [Ruegeria sp.]
MYLKRFEISLPEMEPMILNLRTTVTGHRPQVDLQVLTQGAGGSLDEARVGEREAFFDGEWVNCDIYRRELLPNGAAFEGPAIIEQNDTTVVVDPGACVTVDQLGNLRIDIGAKG